MLPGAVEPPELYICYSFSGWLFLLSLRALLFVRLRKPLPREEPLGALQHVPGLSLSFPLAHPSCPAVPPPCPQPDHTFLRRHFESHRTALANEGCHSFRMRKSTAGAHRSRRCSRLIDSRKDSGSWRSERGGEPCGFHLGRDKTGFYSVLMERA